MGKKKRRKKKRTGRNRKKPIIADNEVFESDETFAFIAGYTEGGAPYGITWEEREEESIEDILNSFHKDMKQVTILFDNRDMHKYFAGLLKEHSDGF